MKKRLFILIFIVFIVIVTTVFLIVLSKNKKKQFVSSLENISIEEYELIEEPEEIADIEPEIIEKVDIGENEAIIEIANTSVEAEPVSTSVTKSTETTKATTSQEPSTAVSSPAPQGTTSIVKQTQVSTYNTESAEVPNIKQEPITVKNEEPKQEEKVENTKEEYLNTDVIDFPETPKELEQKYVVNNNMIARMKSIIENSPSQLMVNYGYNIVIDSSVTSHVNQFTFTEQRVKDKLTHKCGTIRIYSQDYYLGGELLFTECYID